MSAFQERLDRRIDYPGEFTLLLCPGSDAGISESLSFELVFQRPFDNDWETVQAFRLGAWEIRSKNGEVYALVSADMALADVSLDLQSAEADLAFFVGNEPAHQFIELMRENYTEWLEDGASSDTRNPSFRFTEMAAYNEMFLDLCEQIEEREGTLFDRAAKARELYDFWRQEEGERNVPGQRAWYAQNGPTGDMTRAEYDANVAQFEQLIEDGKAATAEFNGLLV